MNRGNAKATVFHDDRDYEAFEDLMHQASQRISMRILAWCLMPNHFHLVLRPYRNGDLSCWMHWLLTAHVKRHRRRHVTVGRIWQGRFTAPPVQRDCHLLIVMRYAERNPVRGGLVRRAEDWHASSLRHRVNGSDGLLHPAPIPLPEDWVEFVNEALTEQELEAVRKSARRGSPFGDRAWTRGTAERLELLDTLNPPGRPRNKKLAT